MKAFIRIDQDRVMKAYDMGDDWKITMGDQERWFSTLSACKDRGLDCAIGKFMDSQSFDWAPSDIVYT